MSHFLDVKNSFLSFYSDPTRKHAVIEGTPLVALNDPTLLFVNSGMFPLVPYLSGDVAHPMGKRICNVQRSIRTDPEDFEEIGDKRHTTVFNMLGNWSLGDYFKKDQIHNVLKLYVDVFKLDPYRIFVSVFEGNEAAPKDEESIQTWKDAFKEYGIDAEYSEDPTRVRDNFDENGNLKKKEEGSTELFKQVKIFSYPDKKNWWKRGYAPGELGGPDSEMFFDLGKEAEDYYEGDKIHINSDNGRFLEIGNSVFMQYKLDENLKWKELSQKNVDFGGGLERVMICQLNMKNGTNDIFGIEIFTPFITKLEEISGLKYKDEKEKKSEALKAFRIVSDHMRAAILLMGDSVIPSNKEHGYVLRRFIRRAIRFGMVLGITSNFTKDLASYVIDQIKVDEPQLEVNKENILIELEKEEIKFRNTLENGLKEFNKMKETNSTLTGRDAFYLFESFGFPLEMSLEELSLTKEEKEQVIKEFNDLKKSHQDLSRSGSEKKFKGGLADTSEITTALHTTHHLLLAALQKIVSKDIHQRGSNITTERLRIDFNYESKLTPEQISLIEKQVNEWIDKKLVVERLELSKEEAEKLGAEHEFGAKYGDIVTVYRIKDGEEDISKEFCGGPHVTNTSQIGELGKFKILKEESSSSGIRRIKATLVK
jgi:alanyl-tRNA synthetase